MADLPESPEPDAIVAGTLCLMSCAGPAGTPVYVRRIVANLEKLSQHPRVTLEMRTVCRRLAAQWEQRLNEFPSSHGPASVH